LEELADMQNEESSERVNTDRLDTENGISRRAFLQAAATLPIVTGLPRGLYPSAEYGTPSEVTPFSDAIVVWHMDDPNLQPSRRSSVRAVGDVTLGVPLEGDDRMASLARGGDGLVAEFRGGYLLVGSRDSLADLAGKKQMTLCVRMRAPQSKWDVPLLSLSDSREQYASFLLPRELDSSHLSYQSSLRAQGNQALEFVWRTTPAKDRFKPEFLQYDWFERLSKNQDFVDGVLRLQAPLAIIAPDQWHDIVVRFNNANLEFFLDGVLIDEEWPHGAFHGFKDELLIGAGYCGGQLHTGFHGKIDHVALWDRPLADHEIAILSGGVSAIAARAPILLGRQQARLQYWLPLGLNTFVGDCMPTYYDGEFHLYYLFDRHHHTSKWGMGAHQFAHASSKDLIHWTHHPMAVEITEQWECSIGTGTIVQSQGKLHASYIQHGRRCWFKDAPFAGDTIHFARSYDREHFKKDLQPAVPWVYLRRENGDSGDINPDIFPDQTDSGYYLSLSGERIWTSRDFHSWKVPQEMDGHRDIGDGICSSYVEWNGWHYIVSSSGYRMSREPLKPRWSWSQPESPAISEGLSVPQAAPFSGNRCLLVGFLGGQSYAGEAVFRELIQYHDGTLGTKWPAEMIPNSGAPLSLSLGSEDNGVRHDANNINVISPDGFAFQSLINIPQNVRITMRIRPGEGVRSFGVCVRGEGAYERGCELSFEPKVGCVKYGTPVDGGLAGAVKPGHYGSDFEIRGVDGLDKAFDLDMIVRDDFVDSCIDQRRTIITKRPDRPKGDRLFFFVDHGETTFETVKVRPLL
jgi:hypothetical protein